MAPSTEINNGYIKRDQLQSLSHDENILFVEFENKFYLIGGVYYAETLRRKDFCASLNLHKSECGKTYMYPQTELVEDMTKLTKWIEKIIETDKVPLTLLTPESQAKEEKKLELLAQKGEKYFSNFNWFWGLIILTFSVVILICIYFKRQFRIDKLSCY